MEKQIVILRSQDATIINGDKNQMRFNLYGKIPNQNQKFKIRLVDCIIPCNTDNLDRKPESAYIEVRSNLGKQNVIDTTENPVIGILFNQTRTITNEVRFTGCDTYRSYNYSFICSSPNFNDIVIEYYGQDTGELLQTEGGDGLEDSIIILSIEAI